MLLLALPVAAVVGAAAGLVIGDRNLTKYTATTQLDMIIPGSLHVDAALFRNVQAIALSPSTVRAFGEQSGPTLDRTGLNRLLQRLDAGDTRSVRVDYNYGVTRADLRDMPETVARDFGTQVLKDGTGAGPVISATDARERVALGMARLMSAVVLDSALRFQLQDFVRTWTASSLIELAANQVDILNEQANLASLERRLAAMRGLREVARAAGPAGEGRVEDSTVVQVAGARFLSIAQQYLAIESEKIDVEERLRQARLRQERIEIRKRIGDVTRAAASQMSLIAPDLLKATMAAYRSETDKLKRELGSDNVSLQRVVGDLDVAFTGLEFRYINQPVERISVRREGPSTFGAAFVGMLAGIALLAAAFALWFRLKGLAAAPAAAGPD